jgi:hypothetical protein
MSLPLDHLSATSISLFLRCPRQFQEVYINGVRDLDVSSALVIGSAVHLALSRLLKGMPLGSYFDDAVGEHTITGARILWKDKESAARKIADRMVVNYYHRVGRTLNVLDTEQELLVEIPGVDIPLLGYVDILTDRGVIDVKTTAYVSRQPELQKSWKLQMNIYQLEHPQPGEFHVLTRSTTNPIVVPDSPDHPFYVPTPEKDLATTLRAIYRAIKAYYEEFGTEEEWPGNLTHEWAGKYCPLKGNGCCQD